MKNKLIFLLLIINFILIEIVQIDLHNSYNQLDKKYREFLANQTKVIQAYMDTYKTSQNVNKSLEEIYKRVWQCEDNVKLQNTFMGIQFEKYQSYYLKHWK